MDFNNNTNGAVAKQKIATAFSCALILQLYVIKKKFLIKKRQQNKRIDLQARP